MEKLVRKAIIRYLKKHFPGEEKAILRKADSILPDLRSKAPHICALDHTFAKLMHAKLIRTYTVATGADSCDYWYVPDKSAAARDYNGTIV